jgi:roadblock/LC7 domain-containing protein
MTTAALVKVFVLVAVVMALVVERIRAKKKAALAAQELEGEFWEDIKDKKYTKQEMKKLTAEMAEQMPNANTKQRYAAASWFVQHLKKRARHETEGYKYPVKRAKGLHIS